MEKLNLDSLVIKDLKSPEYELNPISKRLVAVTTITVWVWFVFWSVADIISLVGETDKTKKLSEYPSLAGYLHNYRSVPYIMVFLAVIAVGVILYKISHLRPMFFRLVDENRRSPDFLHKLADLSSDVKLMVDERFSLPAKKWKHVYECSDRIMSELMDDFKPSNLYLYFVYRALFGLCTLLVTLSLLAASISACSGGLFVNACHGLFIWSHLYFTVITFLTIGYGDLSPSPHWLHYFFIGLVCLSIITVTYFLIIKLISEHLSWETTLQDAVRGQLVQTSDL